MLTPQLLFAHRGARAHVQENTLPAFALAVKLGATGLESDVWLTRDGVAVLDHDGVVGSRLRRRSIKDVDSADLPPHIPTFEQLLDLAAKHHKRRGELRSEYQRRILRLAREASA